MGLFANILEKLGIHSAHAAPAPLPTPIRKPGITGTQTAPPPARVPAPAQPAAPSPPQPVTVVDVVAQLEKRAAANSQKLNWRTSIVDLLKLLDIDSSLPARKALATELGCPPALMGDSAQMNMWLHKTVLAHIAANGGNVPKDLLD